MEYVEEHVFRWGVYSFIRWCVETFDVEANNRWCVECKVNGQWSKGDSLRGWCVEFKIEGLRSKVEAICYRHQPSLSAIAISHSRQLYLSFSFTSTGNNSHFSIRFYFVKVGDCVTGDFLHIYTMSEGQKEENGKGVCTRADDRVHTVGEVSSDTLL